MSSSDPNSSIFLTDTMKQIKKKINSYAFSGGGRTKEEQMEFGANLEIDIPYNYLKFFMEDEERLKEIGELYQSGKMLTSEIKAILIELLQKIVGDH